MIDLEALKQAASSRTGDKAVVTRRYLAQIHAELAESRERQAREGACFGLRQGQRL